MGKGSLALVLARLKPPKEKTEAGWVTGVDTQIRSVLTGVNARCNVVLASGDISACFNPTLETGISRMS